MVKGLLIVAKKREKEILVGPGEWVQISINRRRGENAPK
jgi:hypothetical protein